MHDLEFNHLHVEPGEEINEVAWSADNVELTTVGIDIGSSTSHLMFARVHLQRLTTALSSRFFAALYPLIGFSPVTVNTCGLGASIPDLLRAVLRGMLRSRSMAPVESGTTCPRPALVTSAKLARPCSRAHLAKRATVSV